MDVFTDPRCLLHDVPLGFPEQPSRLASILGGLRATGRTPTEAGPHADAAALVEQVHTPAYVRRQTSRIRARTFLSTARMPKSRMPSTYDGWNCR